MLLHESCHFYGLQWLICLFKFSIKPGGTGRIRKGEQCSVVLASRAPWGDIALPDLRSSGYCADSSHSLEQGCGVRLQDSFQTAQEKKSKSKCFVSPPPSPPLINHSAFSLSFVQVALSRIMPLKCQLSVWTCIALDIKYSSPHTNSQCCTERNKIWSLHFPFPWRPSALIICQSDRCFSNDGVSCVLNFYQSPTVRDCGTLYTIWW